jgi:2-phospho-L-lactate guanylyltransferase
MSGRYPVFAILPVKGFDQAKSRLAPLLRPGERAALARIMFDDVLASLGKVENLAQLIVVTEDSVVAALAGASGASVVARGAADGVNVAINTGIANLPAMTPCGVIVVPADIPHVQAHHIEMLVNSVAARSSVALVPASRDDGTNILAFSPHDLLRPSFGKASFPRHVASARGAGIEPDIFHLDRLDLDLDVPSDLLEFLSLGSTTRTHTFLIDLNLDERWRDVRHNSLRGTWRSRRGKRPYTVDTTVGAN